MRRMRLQHTTTIENEGMKTDATPPTGDDHHTHKQRPQPPHYRISDLKAQFQLI
jgi:hypothetical protein